jgi:hypothetical protein
VTGAILALALSLGSWAYQHRRGSLHEGRLKRLVAAKPTSAQVNEALLAEGAVPIQAPATEKELADLASRWSPRRSDDVVSRRQRWPEIRVYALGDVVYFLYFDGRGVLKDAVYLGR